MNKQGLDDREILEFPNIHNFFIREENIFKIIPIINRKRNVNNISLSLLDWFVTNYVKNNKVVYNVKGKTFDVYNEYKTQLFDYNKKYFDPFNREGLSLELEYRDKTGNKEKDIVIETTFRQLNFLRWIIKNKIIDYIETNFIKINQIYKDFKKNKEIMKKTKKEVEVNKENVKLKKEKKVLIEQLRKTENTIIINKGKIIYKFATR